MMSANVKSSKKAQMKIQQMAFMLVTLVVFFGMVALIYFSISIANLRKDVSRLQDDEAMELARKMSGTPEFAFTATSDCSSCIDVDKIKIIQSDTALQNKYKDLWNIDYLMVECVSTSPGDCYPDIEVIPKSEEFSTKTAFVTLARWDTSLGNEGNYRYDLGRIHTSNLLE